MAYRCDRKISEQEEADWHHLVGAYSNDKEDNSKRPVIPKLD